jgi:hypothetical protein
MKWNVILNKTLCVLQRFPSCGTAFQIYSTPLCFIYVLERCKNLLCVLLVGANYNNGKYSVFAINLQAVVYSCCLCLMVETLVNHNYSCCRCVTVRTLANRNYSCCRCVMFGTLVNHNYSCRRCVMVRTLANRKYGCSRCVVVERRPLRWICL